jgi:hypothetical protein
MPGARAVAEPLVVTPDTVLVRRRDLVVRLGDADDVVVSIGDDRAEAPPHTLAVLEAFANPRRLSDVLESSAASPEQWIELTSAVMQLARAGVLVVPGAVDGPDAPRRGFASPAIHIVMLDDDRRTDGFIRALRAVTTSDDVVVDIGTGTGILATSAALAGARHVHAIESSDIADAAEQVFRANGVADRVSVVRGRSTSVTLPERGDVLVTEIIGNEPLAERLLETVDDAKKRLLTPAARLIPSAIEVVCVPVDIPRRTFERHVFTAERIAAWRARYGVDLSPLASVRLTARQPIPVKTADFVAWPRPAAPVQLFSIDLARSFDLVVKKRVSLVLERDVERLGIVLAFRATLAPGIVLSTLPDEVDPLNSWRYLLWPALDGGAMKGGTTAQIDYAYDRGATTLSVIAS